MINFLNSSLIPKVVCDKSAMDGYEAKNLISGNFLERANGFLAYTTIKPPIELDFELICPVDIHYIQIKSSVGNHRSTGLEIFAECSGRFVSIGKSLHDDEEGVVFLSSRQYTREKLPENLPKNFRICFLKRVGRLLHNAKKIKIRIIRSGKFVPCLGSVEIWGKVARNCSDVTKETVQKLYDRSKIDFNPLIPADKMSENVSKEGDGIPEDFKDDLTYQLMTIPMTLPSGKTIDQSTLDKHVAFEKDFGRKPGDPFTGLKFTSTSKPILNSALKCRIDMFVLQNSSKPAFFTIARTVGRKEKPPVNRCENNVNKVKKLKLDDGDEIIIDTSKFNYKQFKDIDPDCCCDCKSTEMLFSLPCKHLYCRKCLNAICYDLKCKNCNELFSRSNVERFHS